MKATCTLVQDFQLLGQLDVVTAEARMAERQVAEVQHEMRAVEEFVKELAVDLAYEREASNAVQRRCDVAERQLAIEQCKGALPH